MRFDFNKWIRQQSTLHGLAVLVAGIGGVMSAMATGSSELGIIVGWAGYVLVHLGIDDHSAGETAASGLASELIALARGGQVPALGALIAQLTEVAKLFPPDAPPVPPASSAGLAPLAKTAALLFCLVFAGTTLAACARPAVLLSPAGQTAAEAAVTLAGVAAQQNKTVAQVVQGGQLFCQHAGTIVAVVDTFVKPTSVVNKAAQLVAEACPIIAGIQTVPTPAPTDAGSVPVVVVAAAAPLSAPG